MYRLTVVAGPGRGTTFKIGDGENGIGRQLGNTVVLPSSQVSKRHCVLVASHGEIIVRDLGSSNGTFVNGVLARSKPIKPGDRIGVGEYVLELSAARQARQAGQGGVSQALQPMASGGGNVLPFPPAAVGANREPALSPAPSMITPESDSDFEAQAAPKDLRGRALWAFENYVMPFFYGLNLKNEWRVICAILFGAFLVVNLVVSVQPLLDANTMSIMKEAKRRASFMARVIAAQNTAALAAGDETRTVINLPLKSDSLYRIGREGEGLGGYDGDGVTLAVLTDLNLRIIAPAQRQNQTLISGPEAAVARMVAPLFVKGRQGGVQVAVGSTAVAVEPIKVVRGGQNRVIAMAVVGLDASTSMLSMGEVGVVYSETIIITGLVGILMLMILYRLTLKPFMILGEDMDKALKGEISEVTHEFKVEELNPLWDLINSAIQRIPRSSSQSDSQEGLQDSNPEQFVAPIRSMAETLGIAVALCDSDRKVIYLSPEFERITGIHPENATGQDFSNLGSDESIGIMVRELFDQTSAGSGSVGDNTEFGGTNYQLQASAFGAPGDLAPRAYLLAIFQGSE